MTGGAGGGWGGRPDAVLIAGPTASGKSALALALAERLGGEIVNADAMQSYREVRVLSARPSAEEEARVRHHLYGYLSAHEERAVAAWLERARGAAAEARERGRIPIVVGGAGLYIECFDAGIAAIPVVPDAVRAAVRERVERDGAPACHEALMRVDPALAARVAPADRQRIARGLEVWEASGKPLSVWQAEAREAQRASSLGRRHARLALAPERTLLYARCEARFDAMLGAGALDEVAALRDSHGDVPRPLLALHGVAPLLAHLRGECVLEEAAAAAKQQTRNYAKRQTTWARRRMSDWDVLPGFGDAAAIRERALSLCA